MSGPWIRPGFYKHFKTGTVYQVEGVGKHSESEEDLVAYRAPNGTLWFRPYENFISKVKLDDGTEVVRFEYLERDW